MQISQCSHKVVELKEEFPLTFDDIQKEEGIYLPQYHSSAHPLRLVVVKTSSITVVLYLNRAVLQPADSVLWTNYKFRKTNETLCMEVK